MVAWAARRIAVVEGRHTDPALAHHTVAGARHTAVGAVRRVVLEVALHTAQVEADVGLEVAHRTGLEAHHTVQVGELHIGLGERRIDLGERRTAVVEELHTGPEGVLHIAGVAVHRIGPGEAADPTAAAGEEAARILVAGIAGAVVVRIPVALGRVSLECAAGMG
jgi:hypothetical protein